ncbi:MAG: histone deacetylase family protein [Vicinamibacterales bacterium]
MRVVSSRAYELDIGPHVWPLSKYRLIRDALSTPVARNLQVFRDLGFIEPTPASWDDLTLVHTPEYVEKTRLGRLSPEEIAQLEIPWSREITAGFRLMVGGTMLAARLALEDRIAVHLGGGLHHAFANHGEGFCMFNDAAVAIRRLQRDRAIRRAAVVDCDVHHGNGTAMIFGRDADVFTFSIHQQQNYPVWKPPSDLDIGLADGTRDTGYLAKLEGALQAVVAHRPEVVAYLAGADPFKEDQLGGLSLTKEGLRRRDRMVFDACSAAGVPVFVTLAGGYARRVEDTVDIHVATVEEAISGLTPYPSSNKRPATVFMSRISPR